MPRPRRISYPGAIYHIYNRGVNKQPIVHDIYDRKMFFSFLSESIKVYNLKLFAFCLMDNHYHLFLQTIETNLSKAMWQMSLGFSKFINNRYNRIGPLFQGRYQARIVQKESYGKVLLSYIHNNPLEAKITKSPEKYPWSSYGSYIGNFPQWNYLDINGGLLFFDENPGKALKDFKNFHLNTPSKHQLKKLKNMRYPLF